MRKWAYFIAVVAMLVFFSELPVTASETNANPGSLLPSGNVYQKLANKETVRIAILGDSIACPLKDDANNSWYNMLAEWLRSQYKGNVVLDNFAIGGTVSYTGYYVCKSTMQNAVNTNGTYDLVIVCYGQNDFQQDFPLHYEVILRTVKQQNPSCQMITVLQNSQRDYTKKVQQIQRISQHYGADTADMIQATKTHSLTYEQLNPDGVHPGFDGHRMYLSVMQGVISRNVERKKAVPGLPAPLDLNVKWFENFEFIPLDACRGRDGRYQLKTNKATLGVVYRRSAQSNDVHLRFSNGDIWDNSAKVPVEGVYMSAYLTHYFLPANTVVTLENPEGRIADTVLGFVASGPG